MEVKKKTKNNKKAIAITTSIFLLFVFGMFSLPIVKGTETYTTTEEHTTTKDAYTSSYSPDWNSGYYPLWYAGMNHYDFHGGYSYQYAYFGFNLSNTPENTIKTQIKVPINTANINQEDVVILFTLSTDSWDENTITYNNRPNATMYVLNVAIFIGFLSTSLYYIMDITSQILEAGDEITVITEGNRYNSSLDEYPITGYTKECGDTSLVTSIIYTIEHEIVLPQNNDIVFLLTGLFSGLSIGLVVAGIFLKKWLKLK